MTVAIGDFLFEGVYEKNSFLRPVFYENRPKYRLKSFLCDEIVQ